MSQSFNSNAINVPLGANFLNTATRTLLPVTGSLGYDPSLNILYYGSNDLWYQITTGSPGTNLWTQVSNALEPTTTSNRILLGGAIDDDYSELQVAYSS